MKQKEKSALSRERILEAALEEFSRRGYEGASLNAVWAERHISKGMLYHHFKGKDALYLACVARCFDALTAYLKEAVGGGTARERVQRYFDCRLRFFEENPQLLGMFADATLQPPSHLEGEIAQMRGEFDRLNVDFLTQILDSLPLREGLSSAQAVQDIKLIMVFFNTRFRMENRREGADHSKLLCEHEKACHRLLDMLLYGVIEMKEQNHG